MNTLLGQLSKLIQITLGIAAIVIGGCMDRQPDTEKGTDTDRTAKAVIVPRRDRAGMDTTSRPVSDPMVPVDSAGDPAMRRDTVDGTLTVTGSGAMTGKWKFYDVTASLDEQARGGSAATVLQIEGHRAAPGANIRIRLVSGTGAIHPGTFSLNAPDADPRVEASWDIDGNYYRDLNGNGSVTISSYDGKRITGSFALQLAPLNPAAPKTLQELRGVFDQRVMK